MTTLNIVIAEIILCLVLAWLLGYFISWLFAKGAKTKYESEIQELHSGIEERDSSIEERDNSIGQLDDDNIQHILALRENKMALMVANDKAKNSVLELNKVDSKLKSIADELELSKSENQELNNSIVLNKKELLGLKEKNSQLKKIDFKLKLTTEKLEESENENRNLNNIISSNKEDILFFKEKNSQIKDRLSNSISEFDISLEKQKQKTGKLIANERDNLLEIKKLKDENREIKSENEKRIKEFENEKEEIDKRANKQIENLNSELRSKNEKRIEELENEKEEIVKNNAKQIEKLNIELKSATKESNEILNTTKKIEELCKKGDSKELKTVVKKYASLLETATRVKQGTIDYLKAELAEKDNALKKALEIKDKAKENPLIEKIFDRIQKFKS